nr:nucleotide-binding alpha-beta plait domain-containing protein [Tanacetum cinerariifolium]
MGSFRSKEDDVNRITTSFFVLSFPDSFSAKDLFSSCKQFGHAVDSYIPLKRTKEGRLWIKKSPVISNGEVRRGADNSSRLNDGNMGSDKSYVNVIKASNMAGHMDTPAIVLDEECVNLIDLLNSLMGKVKEFASLRNLKTTLLNEGFVDLTGKVFWIRAKEVPGWVPELLEELEYDEQSVDGSIEDVNKVTNEGNDGVNSDIDEITKTVFDNSSRLKGDKSDDPFGLYSLTNKNAKVKKDNIHSPIYPPGFTPDNEENTKCDMGENFVNGNVDEEIRVDEGVSDNMKSKGDKVESMSTGRFKKSKAPRSGGSFLNLMEEVVKVSQTIGYNMGECQIDISKDEDTCTWVLSNDGTFSVKSARRLIDLKLLPSIPTPTVWDKFLQRKPTKAKSRRLYVIFAALIWWICRYRNSVTFILDSIKKGDLFDNIRASSFSWISNRGHAPCTKVGEAMSRIQAWKEVVEKVKSQLSKWKMKTLSIGGRLTLLKYVLGSIPVFHMSIFRVPSSVLHVLESIRGNFFNGHEMGSNKQHG